MTKFKDALTDLVSVAPLSKARKAFGRRTAVEKALGHLDAVVARKLQFDEPIGQFQTRILHAFIHDRFAALSKSDLRKVPWALWRGAMPLSEHPDLVAEYAAALRRARRTSWYSTLRQAYFQFYDPKLAQAEKVLELLREGQAIPQWRWSQPSERYRLFDLPGISKEFLDSFSVAVPAQDTLAKAGFKLGLESSNYVGFVFQVLCGRADCRDPEQERWLWEFCQEYGSLRYPEHAQALVDAFLTPWEHLQPEASRRSVLIERLITLLGDPRVNRGRWEGVTAARVQQFIGLLTRDSIEMFLDIVGISALDHHWKYRRAFWMSYLNAGVITDAWILFGPRAYEDARRALKETTVTSRYARLDRPSSKDHSVLLLKLGDLTIAEFSHMGRVWIWPPEDAKKAPRLYRSTYTVPEVTGAQIGFVHAGSDTFSWQTNVSEAIRKYTNIKSFHAEWKPRK